MSKYSYLQDGHWIATQDGAKRIEDEEGQPETCAIVAVVGLAVLLFVVAVIAAWGYMK